MEYVAEMSEEQRIAFMKALARLANADGRLDEEEKEFIREMALIYGIPKERVEEILNIGSDEEIIESVKVINNRRIALELIKKCACWRMPITSFRKAKRF